MITNDLVYERSMDDVRRIDWRIDIAFERQYNASTSFFTIGSSSVGGTDVIRPDTSDVLQEWDRYVYTSYSDRVVEVSVEREEDSRWSVSSAMADFTLNNYDGLFDPDGTSPLSDYMLRARPVRIFMGFDGQYVQVFTGVTEKLPLIDEKAKTASFHCVDFLSTLLDREVDASLYYTDKRVDEILSLLYEDAGLLPTQYDFDRAYVTIPFFYVERGRHLLSITQQLMEAEQGRMFMTEEGRVTFKNRANYDNDPVYRFDAYTNIVEAHKRVEDDIVNHVTIKSERRELQANASYWTSSETVTVPFGTSVTIWATFTDPVTSVVTPTLNAVGTSSYSLSSGSSVTLTSYYLFTDSYKMVFTNSGTVDVDVTAITLYATAAPVVETIVVTEQDTASIDLYGTHHVDIDNPYFQTDDEASTRALALLVDYSTFGALSDIEVKGTPQLQLGDAVIVDIFNKIQTLRITKIINHMEAPGVFRQKLRVKSFNPVGYFTIGQSEIGGPDAILS